MAISDSNSSTSAGVLGEDEIVLEASLRPSNFAEIVGRKTEKENLQVIIKSAQARETSMDHVLFHGPPGLGKTSMAMVLAGEMGVPFHVTSGPVINKTGDLVSLLASLEERSILFIDEIHRLRHAVEEILYPAMEDRAIDLMVGKGPSARSLRLDLPPFTIVGATTKLSMLISPLRDRFGAVFRLDFYSEDEIAQIVRQKAQKMGISLQPGVDMAIAKRSRLTARIAVRILKRVRDLAVVSAQNDAGLDFVEEAMRMLEIDIDGLDAIDRRLVGALYYKFGGKPVGLSTLAASISEEPNTLEEIYEPFLLRKGFIERTPRGRMLTTMGVEYVLSQQMS